MSSLSMLFGQPSEVAVKKCNDVYKVLISSYCEFLGVNQWLNALY